MARTQINLMLVGDRDVGLTPLVEFWCPSFYCEDEYMECTGIIAGFCISTGQPPHGTESGPTSRQRFCSCSPGNSSNTKILGLTCSKCKKMKFKVEAVSVNLVISVISPMLDVLARGSRSLELIPELLAPIDVVALCYTVGDQVSLENAVYKWYPMVQYHCDRVPIVLLGSDPKMNGVRSDKFDPRYLEELRRAVQEIFPVQHVEYMLPDATFGPTAAADGDGTIPRVSSAELGEILAWHGYHRTLERLSEEKLLEEKLSKRRGWGCVAL